MKPPVVPRAMRGALLADLAPWRETNCQFPRGTGNRRRCGVCMRCDADANLERRFRASLH
jgi:hypothetical protein